MWKVIEKNNKNEYFFRNIVYYKLYKDVYGELCNHSGINLFYPEVMYKSINIDNYDFFWNDIKIPMPFEHFVTSYLIYKY